MNVNTDNLRFEISLSTQQTPSHTECPTYTDSKTRSRSWQKNNRALSKIKQENKKSRAATTTRFCFFDHVVTRHTDLQVGTCSIENSNGWKTVTSDNLYKYVPIQAKYIVKKLQNYKKEQYLMFKIFNWLYFMSRYLQNK